MPSISIKSPGFIKEIEDHTRKALHKEIRSILGWKNNAIPEISNIPKRTRLGVGFDLKLATPKEFSILPGFTFHISFDAFMGEQNIRGSQIKIGGGRSW